MCATGKPRGANWKGFLWDATWLSYPDRDPEKFSLAVLMAAEVEWGNWGDIRDDFDKLRVTNAALRVMVFSGGTDHCRVRENLLRRIQADARPTSPIRYLLAPCKPHGPPWFLYDHIDYIDCTGDGVRPSWQSQCIPPSRGLPAAARQDSRYRIHIPLGAHVSVPQRGPSVPPSYFR